MDSRGYFGRHIDILGAVDLAARSPDNGFRGRVVEQGIQFLPLGLREPAAEEHGADGTGRVLVHAGAHAVGGAVGGFATCDKMW